jgi:hypothetical protein
MKEVTAILSAIEHGDLQAAERLLPLVYDELRKLAEQKLAREKPGQTLQGTALVHDAYLRLVDQKNPRLYRDRGHFFAAASTGWRWSTGVRGTRPPSARPTRPAAGAQAKLAAAA